MNKNDKLTVKDIDQWIDNDEFLYRWWKQSGKSKRVFIKDHRAELEAGIKRALNKPPAK